MNLKGVEKEPQGFHKFQYNGKEKETAHSLFWNDHGNRNLDLQLGRWHTVDRLADDPAQVNQSPYQSNWNNPTNLNDPDGDCPNCGAVLINIYVKYSSIISKGNAPAQRLLSGTSGDTPSHVDISSTGRSAIKVTGVTNDVNQTVDVAQELATKAANDTGEALDKGGEAIADSGVILAPFTEGASLALVPIGNGMSVSGKIIKTGNHVAQGNDEQAAAEVTNLGIGLFTNTLTGQAVKQSKKVGNITNKTEEVTQETALGAIGSTISKAWGQVVNFFTENEENDE